MPLCFYLQFEVQPGNKDSEILCDYKNSLLREKNCTFGMNNICIEDKCIDGSHLYSQVAFEQ